jgi:hypothetical protein
VPAVMEDEWQELLYDTADWREMAPLNLSLRHWRNISSHLRQQLPPAFAKGCASAARPAPPPDASPFQLSFSPGGGGSADPPLLVSATASSAHA